MDLGAFAQIEDLEKILQVNSISIMRLRGLRLMKNEESISQEKIDEIVNQSRLENAIGYLTRYIWKSDKKHPAFIYGKVTDEYGTRKEIVAIDYSKLRRKDRNAIKLRNRKDDKRIITNLNMFNSYCGKDVLYVHARQGGGNRGWCPIDTTHPMYLSDCDDYWDSTYCDIYYDLTKSKEIPND